VNGFVPVGGGWGVHTDWLTFPLVGWVRHEDRWFPVTYRDGELVRVDGDVVAYK